MLAQTLEEGLECRLLLEANEVCAKALPHVRANERLVARKPECRSDFLEVGDDIGGYPHADGNHRSIGPETLA